MVASLEAGKASVIQISHSSFLICHCKLSVAFHLLQK